MDEQSRQTPAPYAAGTGSVPVAPDRAGFSRFSAKRSRYPIRSNAARSGANGTLPVPAA